MAPVSGEPQRLRGCALPAWLHPFQGNKIPRPRWNNTRRPRFGLQLRGTRSNRDAIGARVRISSCGARNLKPYATAGVIYRATIHGCILAWEPARRWIALRSRGRAERCRCERSYGESLHDDRGAAVTSGPGAVRIVCVSCFLCFGSAAAWQAARDTPGNFVDITAASGVRFQHVASHTSKKYLPETMGSGVALFDYDNDGRLDIFLVNGAPLSDPTPKGTIPAEDRTEVLESPLSPEERRHLRRRDGEGRPAGRRLRNGRRGRRLRQRRLRRPLRHRVRRQQALSQQRRRHLHRRDVASRRRRQRLVHQRRLGGSG